MGGDDWIDGSVRIDDVVLVVVVEITGETTEGGVPTELRNIGDLNAKTSIRAESDDDKLIVLYVEVSRRIGDSNPLKTLRWEIIRNSRPESVEIDIPSGSVDVNLLSVHGHFDLIHVGNMSSTDEFILGDDLVIGESSCEISTWLGEDVRAGSLIIQAKIVESVEMRISVGTGLCDPRCAALARVSSGGSVSQLTDAVRLMIGNETIGVLSTRLGRTGDIRLTTSSRIYIGTFTVVSVPWIVRIRMACSSVETRVRSTDVTRWRSGIWLLSKF